MFVIYMKYMYSLFSSRLQYVLKYSMETFFNKQKCLKTNEQNN